MGNGSLKSWRSLGLVLGRPGILICALSSVQHAYFPVPNTEQQSYFGAPMCIRSLPSEFAPRNGLSRVLIPQTQPTIILREQSVRKRSVGLLVLECFVRKSWRRWL